MEHAWLKAQRAADLVKKRATATAAAHAVEAEAEAAAAAAAADIDPHQLFMRQLTTVAELSKTNARRRLKAAFLAARWATSAPAPDGSHV